VPWRLPPPLHPPRAGSRAGLAKPSDAFAPRECESVAVFEIRIREVVCALGAHTLRKAVIARALTGRPSTPGCPRDLQHQTPGDYLVSPRSRQECPGKRTQVIQMTSSVACLLSRECQGNGLRTAIAASTVSEPREFFFPGTLLARCGSAGDEQPVNGATAVPLRPAFDTTRFAGRLCVAWGAVERGLSGGAF